MLGLSLGHQAPIDLWVELDIAWWLTLGVRGLLLLVVQICLWGSQITDKKIIKDLCGLYHILTKIGNCGNDLNTGGVKIKRQKIMAINKLVRFLVDTMPCLNIGGGVEGAPRSFKLRGSI